jgi:hypothetical protein
MVGKTREEATKRQSQAGHRKAAEPGLLHVEGAEDGRRQEQGGGARKTGGTP